MQTQAKGRIGDSPRAKRRRGTVSSAASPSVVVVDLCQDEKEVVDLSSSSRNGLYDSTRMSDFNSHYSSKPEAVVDLCQDDYDPYECESAGLSRSKDDDGKVSHSSCYASLSSANDEIVSFDNSNFDFQLAMALQQEYGSTLR